MSKRPPAASSSSSRNAPPADDEERDRLLDMLSSHGHSFLSSFELPVRKSTAPKPSKKKRKLQELQETESIKQDNKPEAENTKVPIASTSKAPDVVVFDARAGTSSQPLVRGKGKGFMSSKIHHVQSESQPKPTQSQDSDGESDQEISNSKNDKLLHELVHSQLLSNPHAFDAKQGSAKRSRTVAGRLLELADSAKIGRGADALKAKESSRHAKRVRLGLLDKAKEREVKALEEAKTLGNYHPSIKKNFDALGSGGVKRKRERGLALGVGKFRNGALTLSKNDIRSVESAAPSTGPRKGKGGRRH